MRSQGRFFFMILSKQREYGKVEDNIEIVTESNIVDHGVVRFFTIVVFKNTEVSFIKRNSE